MAYYGSLSIGDLLASIDPSTMVLGALFIIFFGCINFALSKFFKESKGTSAVVSFVISLLMVWFINQSGFDYENFFYDIGIQSDFLYVIAPFILLAVVIYLVIKFKSNSLFIVGGLFYLAAWFAYEKILLIVIGTILIIIGIVISTRKKEKHRRKYDHLFGN